MFYLIHSPRWLQKLYPGCLWKMPAGEKKLYLTFDDGPHPEATSFVLEQLDKWQAKATFFCIGKNVAAHREVYQQLLDRGHRAGNHTYEHLNGWKTGDAKYLADVQAAAKEIDSRLFRPPYGRIKRFQLTLLKGKALQFIPVMWTVLSGDFDPSIDGKKCAENVILHADDGAIIVFHDSAKALQVMKEALPIILDYYTNKGFKFESLHQETLKIS